MGKKGGLLTILTGVVIVGCSLVNSCTHNSRILVPKKQITQESFQTLETKLIPFRVYYPPSKPKIKIKDSLLEVAVTESYSPNELSLLVSNPNYSDNFKDEHLGKIEIKDYEKFRSGVLDVAGKFGYSEENIIRASIHDLIMLSGKIVAEKLEYCINKEEKEMMKDKEKFFIYLWHDAFSKDKILRKNKETEKIDNFSEDEIFLNGKGLCRNYVEVNCAVFKVLKDISPKLANTYMRNYSLGFRYGFFHAWNQITTFSGDEQNLEMLVTYVDPTWLDTRKQTELGDGKKMTKLDEETLYDAYDREHFGHNNIYAHIEIADLLCSLGKNQRRASKNYPATNEQIKFY
ncbi:MAG: hypothetical protein ABIG37_00745, partial [Nanoarchaeota archaeon]|nr:hypothetical protein [Nanoarchaeota archaeon]